MWTRKILKLNAKAAFKKNYPETVVVSLIFILLSLFFDTSNPNINRATAIFTGDLSDKLHSFSSIFLGLFIIMVVIGIALKVLIYNPFEVGFQRFFIDNHNDDPKVGTILYAFKTNYINIVKTMFLKDIYVFLWTMLFVIPGIIKSYSYRLVPFILAENPDMNADDAIRLSMEMMNGEKLNAFILNLSFIPWLVLSAFTFYIIGIFYVFPYINATNAELYLAIKNGDYYNDQGMFSDNFFKNGGGYYG